MNQEKIPSRRSGRYIEDLPNMEYGIFILQLWSIAKGSLVNLESTPALKIPQLVGQSVSYQP